MTIVERAIDHLATQSEPVSTESLAAAVGTTIESLIISTRAARQDGRITSERIKGQGCGLWWTVPAAQDPEPFNAAAWADGDLDLYGFVELDDGGVRLTPDMVVKLRRLLVAEAVPC